MIEEKLFEIQYSFLHEWDEVVNRKFPLKMNVNVSETKFRYQFISATSPLHPGAQDLLSSKAFKVNSIHIINPLYSWESLDPRRRNHRQADRLQEGVKAWLQGELGQNLLVSKPCVISQYLQLSSANEASSTDLKNPQSPGKEQFRWKEIFNNFVM